MVKLQISSKEIHRIMERDNCPIQIATVKAVKPYSDMFFRNENGHVSASRRKIMDDFIYPYVEIVD